MTNRCQSTPPEIAPNFDDGHKMNLRFKLGSLLLLSLLMAVTNCPASDAPRTLVLVSGVDPEHGYLRKQIQFLEEVLKSLDYKLEVQQHQSAECFVLSNSGQVDGEIWRIRGVDAEYKNLIRVPVSLWSHPELAFVKKDVELSGWESLAPYRVAFRAGTKVVENNIKGIVKNQVPLDTIDEAFGRLAIGEVDVVVSDNIVGTLLLKSEKYQDSGIRVVEKPLDSALLFTYLHKRHSQLVPRLAKAISLAKHDGTYERIVGEPPVDESVVDELQGDSATETHSSNWHQSSGPNGNWIVDSPHEVPQEFSVRTGKNILWTMDLPEAGQGGLTVWEDKSFLSVMKPIDEPKEKEELKSDTILAICVDTANQEILWKREVQGTAKSPYLYGFSDSTTPAPVTDGKRVWDFNANPICVNGKLFFTTMSGIVYCIETQREEFDEQSLISVNDLGPKGDTWTLNTPSFASGKLFHRTSKHLICIGTK